jgi:hypothetical protein
LQRLKVAGGEAGETVPPRKYVVAIRGTILRRNKGNSINAEDISANLKIFLETLLADRDLYEPVTRLVKAICKLDGVNHVWIAGHSLGAMIAFIATRELALHETDPLVLDPHLFNLPYASIFGLLNSVCREICQKVDSVVFFSNLFKLDHIREKLNPVIKGILDSFARAVDPQYPESVREESALLMKRNYFPYLYLNPNDPICRKYIDHFRVQEGPGQSTRVLPAVEATAHSLSSSLLRCLKINARSCARVTHARVIINHWGLGPKETHKLHQWFLYPTVEEKVYETAGTAESQEGAGES